MEKLSFKLAVFEGPLDALLYLISKNKLDICDVSISELLDQYLGYLSEMREMNLEITSDFLEMASRLVQIKSSMLLPKDDDGKSEKDEFLQNLIEYKTCKEMAAALRKNESIADIFVREPQKLDKEKPYSAVHDAKELHDAYILLGNKIKKDRPPTTDNFTGIVGVPVISVLTRIVHVVKRLVKTGSKSFSALFDDVNGRSEAVATFLAVLELIRSKKVVMDDDNNTVSVVKKPAKQVAEVK